MRKHGWQLPYHPLQVVAVAVFLALGFAFYVFFAPFVGNQLFQYIVMGIYTPLLVCAFGLYIWCAGADPADPGVFKSKKYLKVIDNKEHMKQHASKHGGESTSSVLDGNATAVGEEAHDKGKTDVELAADRNTEPEKNDSSHHSSPCRMGLLALLPCAYFCNSHEESSDHQSEDGMFYCSLCEVEVFKYSKHCRVCDKCVDRFDHHCRWLNNCIGKRNYRKFFTLMVSALVLLIIQWSTGILVLILCFLKRKQFATDISSKLGSSFTVVPFVIVVAVCTILAMIATLPLSQLFFFHILLIKKGISTYDYIIALREQEQLGGGGQQSPQMSPVSSITGLSSASSFNTFHRAAWCTPPRLFVEDQFDVVPPDNVSVSSLGKRTMVEETKKKNPAAVKISPWTLARLNADDVSKAAAEARKKSKILRPVVRHESSYALETDSSFGSSGRRMDLRPDNNRKRGSRRIRLPADMPLQSLSKLQNFDPQNGRDHAMIRETSTSLAPLQLEARSDFRVGRAMPVSAVNVASSPESSLDSPDIHPFRVSSSGVEEARRLVGLSATSMAAQKDIPLSRSTSDGYDASGGEDSDRVPTRILHRPNNWSSLLFGSEADRSSSKFMPPTSSNHRNL
ncbi:DHHC-type zinc finger family protein [Perilla frutescens var. hirtella]|uniref:S-acyltransferase n=1 Tax=Perilla frutescens var. hirtella TaxID=608512 RepID=A0AAD4ILU1_PERFH|nr:DHHC-type zinc finger family protein [Perilla frutescens var. hirtella]